MTLPFAPLPLPAITTTVSPFLIFTLLPRSARHSLRRCVRLFVRCARSQNLRRERDDPHELLVAQLTPDGTEDAGPTGLAVGLDQHGGVLVELDVGAVGPTLLL